MSEEETLILNLFESYWFEHGVLTSKPTPVFQDEEPKLSRITTLMKKSYSEQFLSSKGGDTESPSPNSVLGPQLQTILSGKEVQEDDHIICPNLKPEKKRGTRRIRRKSTGSRSLSELEFEELQGFMDLGFVFSDEDKDSRLVSIIPGLQPFGKKDSQKSRPYLSEAWDCLDLRIPAFGTEMELKDHLKCWAHNVASTVR